MLPSSTWREVGPLAVLGHLVPDYSDEPIRSIKSCSNTHHVGLSLSHSFDKCNDSWLWLVFWHPFHKGLLWPTPYFSLSRYSPLTEGFWRAEAQRLTCRHYSDGRCQIRCQISCLSLILSRGGPWMSPHMASCGLALGIGPGHRPWAQALGTTSAHVDWGQD